MTIALCDASYFTRGRDPINVRTTGRPLVMDQVSLRVEELTLVRNHSSVKDSGKASVPLVLPLSEGKPTLTRKLFHGRNTERPSAKVQAL